MMHTHQVMKGSPRAGAEGGGKGQLGDERPWRAQHSGQAGPELFIQQVPGAPIPSPFIHPSRGKEGYSQPYIRVPRYVPT